jgi:hypothetical protein
MNNLKFGLLAALLATGSMAALATASFAQVCACPSGVATVYAEEPPPPLPVQEQPPMPAPGYLWTPGYWHWNNVDYYWVPGAWVEPPRPGVLWTPGYWGYSNGVYAFNPGYWGPRVGFYGGVAYGFGYGGSGYLGGRWNNGAFFYNQNVNNFGGHPVVNVYSEPVPPGAVTPGRASFNGGAGGTTARPTPEEAAAANEPHEKPTPAQLQNRRAASMSEGSFASINHGAPAGAATIHPGAATVPAAIPARPAEAATPKGAAIPATAPQPSHTLPHAEHEPPQTQHPSPEAGHEPPQPQHGLPQPQRQTPEPQHARPQPPHEAPQPHAAEPARPQAAAPRQPAEEPKPHAPAPQGKPPGEHPRCGAPGEPPCR